MPDPRSKMRGMKDIRTHAGRADETRLPHQALLRVAWLEMEKYRHVSERLSAAHRVANIDERVRQIEDEQQVLMSKVGLTKGACDPNSDPEGERDSQGSSFKIRY